MIRYAQLSLSFDLTSVQTELLNTGAVWQPHFNTAYYEGSWTGLALRSAEGKYDHLIPDLLGEFEYRDTSHMQHFPSVKNMLSGFECPVLSVRFLNLRAGAVIKQHTDQLLSFENGEARLHFPVFTNSGVEFYIEDERVVMSEGSCWYLNAHLPHRVSNNSDTDRIHLVIDCKVNEWLAKLINRSPKASTKEIDPDADLRLIIKELRMHNSASSDKLAAELEQQIKAHHA